MVARAEVECRSVGGGARSAWWWQEEGCGCPVGWMEVEVVSGGLKVEGDD